MAPDGGPVTGWDPARPGSERGVALVARPCEDCGGTGLRGLDLHEPIPEDPADAQCPSCEGGYVYTVLEVLKGGADA